LDPQSNQSAEWELAKVWIAGYGAVVVAVALYFILIRGLGGRRVVHEFILQIPVVRYVSKSLALARFSWSMEMMNEAGMPILEALDRSLTATNNGAFQGRAPRVIHTVQQGGSITEALESVGLFPVDYCEMIRVGEESGSLSATFRRLARQHFENAEAGMKAVAVALGWIIWIIVAGFLIYNIFSLANKYWIRPYREITNSLQGR
jgi:type II secretory pathway component PulF